MVKTVCMLIGYWRLFTFYGKDFTAGCKQVGILEALGMKLYWRSTCAARLAGIRYTYSNNRPSRNMHHWTDEVCQSEMGYLLEMERVGGILMSISLHRLERHNNIALISPSGMSFIFFFQWVAINKKRLRKSQHHLPRWWWQADTVLLSF